MSSLINYLLEANLGLCLFLLLYWLFLRNETTFSINRIFLLASIGICLIFPLFHFTTRTPLVPTLDTVVPYVWQPEATYFPEDSAAVETSFKIESWLLAGYVYAAGVIIALLIFARRLWLLCRLIWSTKSYQVENFTILESLQTDHVSFSFFNYIFIGKSDELSAEERTLIVDHERIHARQLHSLDILLTSIVGVFFWFNPVIKIYKKIFVHLHEYEADARSVKAHDVNDYCSLLAKVALLSADIKLANHFSNSLTLKRIEMMRKIRSKIKWWKIALITGAIPLFFIVVSCHDQLADVTELARNSSVALDAPQAIRDRFEAVKLANPNSTYVLLEFNEEGDRLLEKLDKAHGIPASIELFTPDSSYRYSKMNTEPEKISFNQSQEWFTASKEMDGLRTFAIIEYNAMTRKIAERAKNPGDVYTVVEQTAMPSDGLAAFYNHVGQKISYPKEARKLEIQGKVFVEFIVEIDGSISGIQAIKGIGAGCDEISVDAVQSSTTKWTPGKIGGVAVRQLIVLPITFKLTEPQINLTDETTTPKNSINEVVVVAYTN